MKTTVPFRHDAQDFLPVADLFMPALKSWQKDLPIAMQLENGEVYRVRLSSDSVGKLLKQFVALGILPKT
jgi:hypothetical protein